MYNKNTQSKSIFQIKILFWTVFAGSRGCVNRVRIVLLLKEKPQNINQLSEKLCLDYKVVQRHLDVLQMNDLVSRLGYRYGKMYFLSPVLMSNLDIFNEVVSKSKNCKEN